MTKKLLSVILSVLMVALLFISVFSVSALSPPYSKNFETQSEMLGSLSDYSDSFPEVEDYFAGDLSASREGYHLENREVIIPVLSAEGYTADTFSYAESSWGKGVDYTFISYINESNNLSWRFMTYYSLNKEELCDSFDVGFEPTEGYIGEYKYIAYDSYSEALDYKYTVCKVIVGDCLVVIYSSRDLYEKLDAIQFVSTEIEIPVYVKDAFEYPEIAEGCNRYFFYMPERWENELSQTAGIYWWEGTNAHESWPGVEACKGDAEGLYYYDVPKDVASIIWNNMLSYNPDDFDSLESQLAEKTRNIATENYEPGESTLYPDGLESFNNMVWVVDFNKCNCNDFVIPLQFGGEWYYYYGNGEYGTTPTPDEIVYTDRSFGENCPHQNPSIPATPEEPDLEPYNRVYFVNTEGWEKVYAYAWINDFEYKNALWPGEEMELSHVDSAGNEIYTALITSKAQGLIFTNNEGKQTTDLTSGVYESNMYCLFNEHNGKYTVMIREFVADYPMGDANVDGKLNVKDATTVQKYVAGLLMSDRFEQSLMDFDKDTKINVKDATSIQKKIAGLI